MTIFQLAVEKTAQNPNTELAQKVETSAVQIQSLEKQVLRAPPPPPPPPTPLTGTEYSILYRVGQKSVPICGLYSSVTECPNEIILSDMTYYHHWFKEFVRSKHNCVHFFQMKVHFRIYLIVWIVGSIQILLNCVWPRYKA